MNKLILDLRFNGGGYLHQAIHVADQFLKKDQMIVYTKGAHTKKSLNLHLKREPLSLENLSF